MCQNIDDKLKVKDDKMCKVNIRQSMQSQELCKGGSFLARVRLRHNVAQALSKFWPKKSFKYQGVRGKTICL